MHQARPTKPWEQDELARTIGQVLREVTAASGVLLVSDDPVALAPVQFALQSQVRVLTTSIAAAFGSDFPALPSCSMLPTARGLQDVMGVRPGEFRRSPT